MMITNRMVKYIPELENMREKTGLPEVKRFTDNKNPVLKNAYLTGGRLNTALVLSIRSIKMSLSAPPEYEQIAFGCSLNLLAIILIIA